MGKLAAGLMSGGFDRTGEETREREARIASSRWTRADVFVTANPIPSLHHPLDPIKYETQTHQSSNASSPKTNSKSAFFFSRLDRFRSGALWRCTRNTAEKFLHHRMGWQKTKRRGGRARNVRKTSMRRWEKIGERRNAANIPQSGNCVRIGLKLKWTRSRRVIFRGAVAVASSGPNRIRFQRVGERKSQTKPEKVDWTRYMCNSGWTRRPLGWRQRWWHSK